MSNTRTILTAEGRRLLNESAAVNGHYWLGHYGLAYVPTPTSTDLDRFRTGSDNRLVVDEGQMIFNLWRGDALEDITAPGYQRELKQMFRYGIDTPGTGYNYLKVGQTKITGLKLPMPAPLWYNSTAGRTSSYAIADAAVKSDISYIPSLGGYPYISNDVRSYEASSITTNSAAAGVIPVADRGWWKASTLGSADSAGRLVSVSNYNLSKSPGINRCSGLFQISSFSVVNSTGGNGTLSASGIRLGIELDISPMISDVGWNGVGYSPILPTSTEPIAFKFNRIGIYATRVSRMYRPDSEPVSTYDKVIFDIDSSAAPVLVAVIEWDSPVTLSEDGNPYAAFSTTINISLGSVAADSSLLRDNIVFYNSSEDDSVKFYKNQMLMNAQVLHAVSDQSVQTRMLSERMDRMVARINSDIDVYNLEEEGVIASELVCADGYGGFGIRKIRGEGVGVKVEGNHLVVSTAGSVTSSARDGTIKTADGSSLAMMLSKDRITSTENILRVYQTGINSMSGQMPKDLTNIGYKLYGNLVAAPHTAISNVYASGIITVNNANWYSNYANVSHVMDSRSILRAIKWSFPTACPGSYAVVVSFSAWNPTDATQANAMAANAIVPVEIHTAGTEGGMIFEPIDLTGSGVTLYVTFIPKGWAMSSSVAVDVNMMVERVSGDSTFEKFVTGDLSTEFA